MAEMRCYPTKYVGLWYGEEKRGKGSVWRFVREAGRELLVGDFADRIDLLAAVDKTAAAFGFTELVDHYPQAVAPKAPAPDKPKSEPVPVGCSVESLWERFRAGSTDADAPGVRHAFYAGFAAMMSVMERGGKDDVTTDAAFAWMKRIRSEIRSTTGS